MSKRIKPRADFTLFNEGRSIKDRATVLLVSFIAGVIAMVLVPAPAFAITVFTQTTPDTATLTSLIGCASFALFTPMVGASQYITSTVIGVLVVIGVAGLLFSFVKIMRSGDRPDLAQAAGLAIRNNLTGIALVTVGLPLIVGVLGVVVVAGCSILTGSI